jgi:molecular chaperone HtpG
MAETTGQGAIPFRAETRQLLDILIHSLYSEREVFLRELISNASDALTRMNFEMLTNRSVLDPEAELGIWITADEQERTLTIRDSGVGMTSEELSENLGTIAHSGARAFLKAAQETKAPVSEIIGQFGVGFYSAFMVADSIRVVSRSFRPEAEAAAWFSKGEDTFTIEPAEKTERGTTLTIHLKEDAAEFAQTDRLSEIIRKHSDFIPFPIYLGEEKQQVNQRSALWRQSPREVDADKYEQFYRQYTLDFEKPLTHTHINVDAPVQLYSLLFIPSSAERTIFSARKEEGLKLYARKVLIQEYTRDLLPEYFRFVQGVVDSEDLQLNVSREMLQSNRVIAQIKRVLTSRVMDMLKKLAAAKPAEKADETAVEAEEIVDVPPVDGTGEEDSNLDGYAKFWGSFGRYIKEGMATDQSSVESLAPLLRYRSLQQGDRLISLDAYVENMQPEQKKIYYVLGDDERSIVHSPHLDVFRHRNIDVILMTDPLDPFVLMMFHQYKEYTLANAAMEKPEDLPAGAPPTEVDETQTQQESMPEDALHGLVDRFKAVLGERVSDVRTTDRLINSPARLVDPEGTMNQEVQRVYRLLNKEFDAPIKVLEINPRHPILRRLSEQPDGEVNQLIIEQIYEDALLIEGLHPDPAGMIERIQALMKAALK